eukprot:137855_1
MAAWFLYLFLILSMLVAQDYDMIDISHWTLSDERFSQNDQNSMVVFDNVTRHIYILGGYFHPQQIYRFHVDNGTLDDVTPTFNPNNTNDRRFGCNYLNNQNTVLINRTIYFREQTRIGSLNVDTFEYTYDIGKDIGMPFYDYGMCLVTNSNQTKLYVVSGYHYAYFVFFDLSTKQFTKGPNTLEKHRHGACHVYRDILYVMSGANSQIIEYIDLNTVNNDLVNAKWNIMDAAFPSGIYQPASVLCNDLIVILGGDVTGHSISSDIYIFDLQTSNLWNVSALPFLMGYGPGICVEDRMYLIMGVHKTTGTAKQTDTLWYADLRRITGNLHANRNPILSDCGTIKCVTAITIRTHNIQNAVRTITCTRYRSQMTVPHTFVYDNCC